MKYPLKERDIFPYRPKPFYFITTSDPEELSYESMLAAFTRLKQQGYGGLVYFNKPETGFSKETYLSDAWFAAVKNAAEACRTLGLVMWINEGFDYPPGAVGGRIRELAPHLTQKYLVLEGEQVTVREADWGFPAFEEPQSTQLFIRLVYEAYKAHLGEYFGNPIAGFFSDADNRRVSHTGTADPSSPQANYFPWSTHFADSFRAAYGYDIIPCLPAILRRESLPQAADYWEHCGHLYQSWFQAHYQWLSENGLQYTGHTSDTTPAEHRDMPRASIFTEGRFADVGQHFHYPGTDQELHAVNGGRPYKRNLFYTPTMVWGREEIMEKMTSFGDISEDMRAKQAAASAFLFGKEGVMCEMFAASNFGVSPQTLSQIAAFQLMQGVNFVVPHAYHHRFRGLLKYFPPPDFGPHSMLHHGVRELNDLIAGHCAMLSKGQPLYPIVLIDPSEAAWENRFVSKEYTDAFHALNHLPYGFTICDKTRLMQQDYGFRVAVEAGFALSDADRAAIESRGIRVISGQELDTIGQYFPECQIRYEGEGTPIYTRRCIAGEEFLFFANVECTEPIRGRIHAYGRTMEVMLYPGDICYLSKTYHNIAPIPANGEAICTLPETAAVSFDRPNLLPLAYFHSDGKTVAPSGEEADIRFSFDAEADLEGISLLVPACTKDRLSAITLNGAQLAASPARVFDEDYLRCALPALQPGTHTIGIRKTGGIEPFNRMFLEGDFDVSVTTGDTHSVVFNATYNIRMQLPDEAHVSLSRRSTVLSTRRSWALEGQPFYSGGVTYTFALSIEQAGTYRLVLPRVRDVVCLTVNGAAPQKAIRLPYDFSVALQKGHNSLELTVYNSFANAMECYKEESGILEGGALFAAE